MTLAAVRSRCADLKTLDNHVGEDGVGMGCALGTGGDMVVSLAERHAPEDVRDRVRAIFANGFYSGEAAQMFTERTGGSDLAALEATAVPDGDSWLLSGFKWFASNANGSAFCDRAGAGPTDARPARSAPAPSREPRRRPEKTADGE
ncbi:hypothetical protein ACQP2T_21140 [Nonomuraea sp. CA-143628]|uniref:hypothetical protein n=1 Tax=Nonomuraea sp. CA-143628 TaxID=3239997 RepID=UPI003D93D7CB